MAEKGDEQLKLEIVADDKTAAILEQVRKGFEALGKMQERLEAGSEGKGPANGPTEAISRGTEAIGVFGGVMLKLGEDVYEQIKEIVHLVPEMVHEAFDAATEETEGIRQLAGQFTLMSTGSATFEQLSEAASTYHDELEAIGLEAGVSADKVGAAFAEILYQSDKGVEGVERLVEDLANASRIVPGGLDALSQGMRMIEFGMVKAKNPVVQLIAATDTLHGNAKQVAAQLSKMTPEEQLKMGEEAIHRMAEKSKELPPSYKELKQTIENIKGDALESLGHEIEAGVAPALSNVVGWLKAHKSKNEEFLASIGSQINQHLEAVIDGAADAFRTLDNHSQELKDAWRSISGDVKSSAEALRAAIGGVGDAIVAMTRAYNFVRGAADMVLGPDEDERAYDEAKKKLDAYATSLEKGSPEQEAELRQRFLEARDKSGIMDPRVGDPMAYAAQAMSTHAQERGAFGAPLDQAAGSANPEQFAAVYRRAEMAHDQAALEYAATVIASSKDLQAAFLQAAPALEGGYGHLIGLVKGKSADFAEALAGLTKKPAQHAMPPVQNFYGGITIKQDFRDQADPDRIVLTMRRDLVEQAESRRQSRLATPFGA